MIIFETSLIFFDHKNIYALCITLYIYRVPQRLATGGVRTRLLSTEVQVGCPFLYSDSKYTNGQDLLDLVSQNLSYQNRFSLLDGLYDGKIILRVKKDNFTLLHLNQSSKPFVNKINIIIN